MKHQKYVHQPQKLSDNIYPRWPMLVSPVPLLLTASACSLGYEQITRRRLVNILEF
jgi:hypothetical protein